MKYTRDELIGFMSTYDHEHMSDGAWFSMLEHGGDAFITYKKLNRNRIDGNDIAHEYLREKSSPNQAETQPQTNVPEA